MELFKTPKGRKKYIEHILKQIKSEVSRKDCDKLNDITDFNFQFNTLLGKYNLVSFSKELYFFAGYYYSQILHLKIPFKEELKKEKNYSDDFHKLKEILDNGWSNKRKSEAKPIQTRDLKNLVNTGKIGQVGKIKITPRNHKKAVEIKNPRLLLIIETYLNKIVSNENFYSDKIDKDFIFLKIDLHTKTVKKFAILFDFLTLISLIENNSAYNFIVDFANILGFDILKNTEFSAKDYLSDEFKASHRI